MIRKRRNDVKEAPFGFVVEYEKKGFNKTYNLIFVKIKRSFVKKKKKVGKNVFLNIDFVIFRREFHKKNQIFIFI